jgi:ribonuclease T1
MKKYHYYSLSFLLTLFFSLLLGCKPNAQNQAQQQQVQQDNNSQRNNDSYNQDDYGGKKGKKHKKHKGNRQSDNEAQSSDNQTNNNNVSNAGDIPQKVFTVLDYVLKNNVALDGYVGGRNFGNFEGHLDKTDSNGRRIKYQEWDVNPKKQGKNRGTQRLITGSDGRNWYTDDHYATFKLVKR